MTTLILQYSLEGKPFSTLLGRLEQIPTVGDEIKIREITLVVKKRQWRYEEHAWETQPKVCLLCDVKGITDES